MHILLKMIIMHTVLFYFFTVLSNYGIIKVIESRGFEIEKALSKVRKNDEGYYISRW